MSSIESSVTGTLEGDAAIVRTSAERATWRAAVAAGVGTTVEYYDFQLFGIMSIFLGSAFFAADRKDSALFATLAVFGGAFLARPLGGFIFGLIGDTKGRRRALLITVLGMGLASATTGLLPSARSIGIAAPLSLVFLRLAQGFFAGGEVTGAATYIAESAPRGQRGFFGAFNPAAAIFGLTLATGISALTESFIGSAAMSEWGWRVPFLLSIPLILACFAARRTLRETPGFAHDQLHVHRKKQPIAEVLNSFKRPLLLLIALGFAQNVAAYMSLLYLSIQLTHWMGYSSVSISWLFAITSFLSGLAMPMVGRLSDTLGRKPVIGAGFLGYAVLSPLTLYVAGFGHMSWTAIAVLAASVPLVLVQATAYPLYAELFPTHVRYTGMSLGFNIATIMGGGTAPYLGAWLVDRTGSNLAPGFYVSAVTLVAFAVSRLLRETADDDIESPNISP
ncbi:MFS transporter [Nguyenibacter sp. L1]|uniref:MFS transporter n=1 Tax=Nguyenibacter sp. L1 TaxID=3049350 RepID=UPI002B467775|nr:MFS transporter [Nguyenibacter sp. L1]WRH89780.1 MFS transporter [Nguyenibacter sp. L1]